MPEEVLSFHVGEFDGSLDLLLFLIRKHQMDIRNIQISVIADDFASYVERMQHLDVFIASDFLVMASTLMEMKSKALLSRDEEKESYLHAKTELENQLQEYEQMKKVVSFLDERFDEAQKRFGTIVRNKVPPKDRTSEIPKKLLDIFKSAYDELKLREKVYKVKGERYSLTARVGEILKRLKEEGELSFSQLLEDSEDRISLIVTFLAILEIVKSEKGAFEERKAKDGEDFWIVDQSK